MADTLLRIPKDLFKNVKFYLAEDDKDKVQKKYYCFRTRNCRSNRLFFVFRLYLAQIRVHDAIDQCIKLITVICRVRSLYFVTICR